jgi:hypothetical protein
MYVIFETPHLYHEFDTARITLLLASGKGGYAFTGVALTGKFLETCTESLVSVDERKLPAAFRFGLNSSWIPYTSGLEFPSLSESIQDSLLSVRIGVPGVTKIEVVLIHAIGDLLPGLIRGLMDQGRVFLTEGTSHLVLSDTFQKACFKDYPMYCVTQTSTIGLVDLLRLPDSTLACTPQATTWLSDNLLLYTSIATRYAEARCGEADFVRNTYFWMRTAYHWPPTFSDWLTANRRVTSFIHIAVPAGQDALVKMP